jgi:hypothetical protein
MVILCDKETKHYFFPSSESCSRCKKIFRNNQVGIIVLMSKVGTAIFCEKCIMKSDKTGDFSMQRLIGKATSKVIPNSFVVNETRLDVEDYKGGVLATDISQIGGKTTDRTRYAKTGGMNMELPERKPLLELDMEKDQELSDQKMIEMLSQSKPVPKDFNLLDHVVPNQNALDYKKQKQIGMREDK